MASTLQNLARTSKPRSCRSKASSVELAAACDHATFSRNATRHRLQVVRKAKPQPQAMALRLKVKCQPKTYKTTRCISAKSALGHLSRRSTWISILDLRIFGYAVLFDDLITLLRDTGLVHRASQEHPQFSRCVKAAGRFRPLKVKHIQETRRRDMEDLVRRLFFRKR